ncbi:hypothetical protein [Algoriphagus antarcticus]|uniref:DUF4062 domain-containing protein n=1 Tax=Algoriphagus antarcticus TaxID=238540 RepID=A0A3E0DEI1_9BACT|nr:hypothetical protein [Algoriphagus antarcticus]REG81120.1 hypothetical protein C8N25_12965 [Algoriphagus antarcticus]
MTYSLAVKYLNLIVVSPGDVPWERNKIGEIVADLNSIFLAQFGLAIQVWRWEVDAYPGFHIEGLQGQIDKNLQIDNCDIMVGIFWKRFGTPVKDADSGTEHELNRAYNSWKASGGNRPQTLVYFNTKPYKCKNSNEEEQKVKVLEYKKKLMAVALSGEYATRNEFENKVRNHLLKYLLDNTGELGGRTYTMVRSATDLLNHNQRIILEAKEHLYMTGSRTRDQIYLTAIEDKLKQFPVMVHHRVLFGPPHHQMLKDHLIELLKTRDPDDRQYGQKTIHLGVFDDYKRQFETFILGNEREALVLLPSLLGVGEYNSGILFTGKDDVDGLRRFVKDLYGWSQKIETLKAVDSLNCLNGSRKSGNPEAEANI